MWPVTVPLQTNLSFTSTKRRLRTSIKVEWRKEVSSSFLFCPCSRSLRPSTFPLRWTRSSSFTPSHFCVVFRKHGAPKACWSCVELSRFLFSASQTDSACWPAFIFLFKTHIDKCAFALKRSWKCYFNKLCFGEQGEGFGMVENWTEAGCHNVVDFNIGCKITNTYNKQNIYSVLKFTVQREFECSFLISVVGDKAGRVIQTIKYIACLLDSSNCAPQK